MRDEQHTITEHEHERALQEAKDAESQIAVDGGDYGLCCQLYMRAMNLGSEIARLWVEKENETWGAVPPGPRHKNYGTFGGTVGDSGTTSGVSRESYYEGYVDDR